MLDLIGDPNNDDVKRASQLLCEGAPLEPVGEHSTHAVILAITSNSVKILNLLLAAGVSLTTTYHGTNLLKLAGYSPDVTPLAQEAVIRVDRLYLFPFLINP